MTYFTPLFYFSFLVYANDFQVQKYNVIIAEKIA